MDPGNGELSIHFHMKGRLTPGRAKHFMEVWNLVVIGLWERGMKTVETWIDYGNNTQKRLAEFFGFEDTGFLKEVVFKNEDGAENYFLMEEMRFVIPLED